MRRFGAQQGLLAIGKNKAKVYVEHKHGVRVLSVSDPVTGERTRE